MTTAMSPRNMLIAGIVLILLNVAALAPMATNAVPDVVEETFESYSKDAVCANDACTEAEEDWASSTSQRDFYGYSITNVADVMATGATPAYEKIGPVTYDITTTRTILDYDATAGELTYNAVKSFECAEDTAVACDTEVSQLNIAFQTQVIGATGMAIGGIMDATKAAFTRGMLAKDLEALGPGLAASQAMSANYAGAVASAVEAGGTETMGANGVGANFYAGWDQFFAANNMSEAGETVTYSMATGSSASFDNLTYAFNSAVFPGSGEDVSLLGDVGTMVFAGHCNAFPTDLANATTRAKIWDYEVEDNATTIANDYAMCYGIGGNFANNFGGGDDTWMHDTTGASINASTRLSYLGITMDNTAAMAMLFGIPGDDAITGLLEVSDSGTEFGVANFLGMEDSAAMAAYGMDLATFAAVKGWAGAWISDASSLPMILLGGSGDMTASLFVNTTFGAEDPLNGGYLNNSLNLGGFWGLSESRDNIDLDPGQSGNVLYGPLGITTSNGAAIFLYGELSGMTPPLDFTTNPPSPAPPLVWDATTIGALYGIDTNAASAMRALMMGEIYGTTDDAFVPDYLMSSFGTTPYLTQSFNNWLLGWHDPVSAYLATGNPMDMTVGWTSLETNATYYSSPNINNGDGTNYTMCTGEVSTCDKGETLAEDGSTQLSWRNDAMFAATYGLITQESLVGTTGGFLTGTDDKVDVSGYAVADVICDGTSTLKGIPVNDCSATVVATERNIQANLLETYSLLDATPGALPVYFGSEITMKAEQLSGLIIAGDSASTFYLDTRAHTNQASTPSMSDLVPVFEIKSSSMIADDDAETMESSIVQNQDRMTYWTNFDSWVDYVTLLFWVGGIAMVAMGTVGAANTSTEEEEKSNDEAADTE